MNAAVNLCHVSLLQPKGKVPPLATLRKLLSAGDSDTDADYWHQFPPA